MKDQENETETPKTHFEVPKRVRPKVVLPVIDWYYSPLYTALRH